MEYVPGSGRGGVPSTPQTFLDWQASQQSFQQFAAVARDSFRIRNERDEPATARAMRVTREFLPLLRIAPLLGRPFTEADEVEGAHRVVILSYGFWQRQFGGAPEAVGQTLSLNGEKWEVVGVLPAGFSWPVGSQTAGELFAPIAFRGDERVRAKTRNFSYSVIGRLKDGVSIAQAGEDMNRLTSERRHAARRDRRAGPPVDGDAARGGCARAPDCVRERRQPDAGALDCPRT
jgi:hypothetical protein